MSQKVIVIGHIGTGTNSLANISIDALKQRYPDMEIITVEEAKKQNISIDQLGSEPFLITNRPKLPEIKIHPESIHGYEFTGKSARALRREAERKAAKPKRKK